MARPSVSTEVILDAAAEAFSAHGTRRTTMEDVALRAGVAKGVLYLRFDSKESLARAVVDREMALALATSRAEVAADPRGGLLSRLFVHSLTALHTRPFLIALYKGEVGPGGRPSDQESQYRDRLPISTDFVRRMRDAGMVRADLEPGPLAANLAVWNVGLALTAPHEDPGALILGMGELVARAADADVTDTTPGKECFARLADDLEALWSRP
ncbi:TetR/AcrR family transcriptional regulator [Nocardiopsis exhalans]|uniref:TetR/AcrR family transcriptional regulator n=1 Tax=Nocardiopsis exhalans TaxID=163604 RepID=A0ABY5D5R2_9ACTN|nr:TetR/AcrR family transcriptional regulator [Nocardiopsis exhalans]USY18579.1 TetR/AcrR family transcriptional regulator [Nocardiopsis exhalans]